MSTWSYTIPRTALGMFIGKNGRNIRALQDIPYMSVLLNDVQLTVHSSDVYRIQLVKDNVKAIVEEAQRIDNGYESTRMHQLHFNTEEQQQFYRPRARHNFRLDRHNFDRSRHMSQPFKRRLPSKRKIHIDDVTVESYNYSKKPKKIISKSKQPRRQPELVDSDSEERAFDEVDGEDIGCNQSPTYKSEE